MPRSGLEPPLAHSCDVLRAAARASLRLGVPPALQRELAEARAASIAAVAGAQSKRGGRHVAAGVYTTVMSAMGTPSEAPHRGRRIRLGYASGNFGQHTLMSTHLLSVFGLHDRDAFEVFCYALSPSDGSLFRRRVEADCEHFALIAQHTPALDAAARIAEDDLDVLCDLDGYTHGGRPEIFAFRPARTQALAAGMPGTTGAPYMDFLLTDRNQSPPRLAHLYSERLLYMPHTYIATEHRQSLTEIVTAHEMAPEARDARRAASGLPLHPAVVFCAFHTQHKITSAVFDVWMEILRRVPGSVLWLLASRHDVVRGRMQAAASAAGIAASRLVFAERVPKRDHVQRTALADIFLDTSPFNACGTAADTLWAGVPVVTCPAKGMAARAGLTAVTAIGFPELAVSDWEAYEELAVALATDPAGRLRGLKRGLSEARATAPLFDTPRWLFPLLPLVHWRAFRTARRSLLPCHTPQR